MTRTVPARVRFLHAISKRNHTFHLLTALILILCLSSLLLNHQIVTIVHESSQLTERVDLAGILSFQAGHLSSTVLGSSTSSLRTPTNWIIPRLNVISGNEGIYGPVTVKNNVPRRIAMVYAGLWASSETVYLMTTAGYLLGQGLQIEVLTGHDGVMRQTWESMGIKVVLFNDFIAGASTFNWLRYEAVIASSAAAAPMIRKLIEKPFNAIPLVWILHEGALSRKLRSYQDSDSSLLLTQHWMDALHRANRLVVTSPQLKAEYSILGLENVCFVSGSPDWFVQSDSWPTAGRSDARRELGIDQSNIAIMVVIQLRSNASIWRSHAVAMHALSSSLQKLSAEGRELNKTIDLLFYSPHKFDRNYSSVLRAMATHLRLEVGIIALTEKEMESLLAADFVLYCGQTYDEPFPAIVIKAMAIGRIVIAPSLRRNEKFIVNDVNGFLFSPDSEPSLSAAFYDILTKTPSGLQKISTEARTVAFSAGAHNVGVELIRLLSNSSHVQGGSAVISAYSWLHYRRSLDRHINTWAWPSSICSSVAMAASVGCVAQGLRQLNNQRRLDHCLGYCEDEATLLYVEAMVEKNSTARLGCPDCTLDSMLLEEMDLFEDSCNGTEYDPLEDHLLDQLEFTEVEVHLNASLDEMSRDARRAGKLPKTDRDDGSVFRLGQQLCIYEPYNGRGAWQWLHSKSMSFRAINLDSKDSRPAEDDITAADRLPLLQQEYYSHAWCDLAAILAIAFHLSEVHKHPWIGFQPWLLTVDNMSLSEASLDSVEEAMAGDVFGDAVFFWAPTRNMPGTVFRQGKKSRKLLKPAVNTSQLHADGIEDFWATCDGLNAGMCRKVFLEGFKGAFDLPNSWNKIPPMPLDGHTWAAMNAWIMTSESFLEFIMFARLFLDGLDRKFGRAHQAVGLCPLGGTPLEVHHCFCRVLDRIVNVWAYHSGRRLVLVDPRDGSLVEQHPVHGRAEEWRMWVNFFSYGTLKSISEDWAEASEEDPLFDRLWSRTGVVWWRGVRDRKNREKESRQKEKDSLMKREHKQKAIGKFRLKRNHSL